MPEADSVPKFITDFDSKMAEAKPFRTLRCTSRFMLNAFFARQTMPQMIRGDISIKDKEYQRNHDAPESSSVPEKTFCADTFYGNQRIRSEEEAYVHIPDPRRYLNKPFS